LAYALIRAVPPLATMKPANFDYAAPETLDEVLALLAEHGSEAKVLAGGQSLVPRMAFRLDRPALLVDINRLRGLDEVTTVDGELAVGARVTHRRLELGVSPDPVGDLLALAGRHIGHLPIRVRGTFGGSIAYADPSAEWCLLAVTLGARMGIASARGHRSVEAGDFFRTPLGTPFEPGDFFHTASSFATTLEPDELIDEVKLPLLGANAGVGFAEFSRRENDSAFVSAAAAIVLDEGKVKRAFLGIGGRGTGPVRAGEAEAVLRGSGLEPSVISVAAAAAASAIDPVSDFHGTAEYRRAAAEVLVRRSIEQAAGVNGRGSA
jgi:carbon-monoxide dehydrogenase medium subunit